MAEQNMNGKCVSFVLQIATFGETSLYYIYSFISWYWPLTKRTIY